MSESILFIIQAAAGELGFPVPQTVAGATDILTIQMLAHANSVGRGLMKEYTWSALTVEPYVITTVANQELYPFPSDFDRMVGNTGWDRTNHWQLLGPDSPQVARYRRESNISVASPRRISRQEGPNLSLYPTDTVGGSTIVFDYVSRNWATTILNSVVTPSYSIGAADADTCVFDTDLMVKGVKASLMMAKGFGTGAALLAQFENAKKVCIAADMGGGEIISFIPLWRGQGNADVIAGAELTAILQEGGAPLLVE